MKLRKILAGALALAMVASVATTAASAATYDWSTISGVPAVTNGSAMIVDGDGKDAAAKDDAARLRPNSTYYYLVGNSAIYEGYLNYEKLIKVKTDITTGGQYLVPGSVKLVDKWFKNREQRYTAIEFKTAQDMTDNEMVIVFNVELTARDNVKIITDGANLPIIDGKTDTEGTAFAGGNAKAEWVKLDEAKKNQTTGNAPIDEAKAAYDKAAATFKAITTTLTADEQKAYTDAVDAFNKYFKLTDATTPPELTVNAAGAAIADVATNEIKATNAVNAAKAPLKKAVDDAQAAYAAAVNAAVGAANYFKKGDVITVPFKMYIRNAVLDGTDQTFTAGTGKQFFNVTKNEWNEVIWEDADNEIAKLYFHADSNTNGFYSQLKTVWSNEWYRAHFAQVDAYKFEFVGIPAISTTHRAELSLYMPFVDDQGQPYHPDPESVYIYRVNEAEGTIDDVTEYFSYDLDNNGKGWYVGDTRVVSTYIISAEPIDQPEEEVIEVVPEVDVKVPANTGK